jgi:nitroreductase
MEVFDAIRTVLAIRSYEARPVPDDTLRRILDAGRLTASAMNRQPWHFVVVRDREQLRRLGAALPTGPYVASAACAVVVTVQRDVGPAVADASRAVQSMVLAAWAEGVGSNWAGWGALDDVRALLAVPPEYDILGVLPFGYPATAAGKGKKQRKPLTEIASAERFGQPFA